MRNGGRPTPPKEIPYLLTGSLGRRELCVLGCAYRKWLFFLPKLRGKGWLLAEMGVGCGCHAKDSHIS